jgi:beta-mannanase
MKTLFLRTSRIILALGIGSLLFILLSYAGSKSKGPLDEMALLVNKNVARIEKNIVDTRQSRSASLQWFDKYRMNKHKLNNTDFLLLGAYDDHTVESYESIISLEDAMKTKLPMISLYTAWGSKRTEVFPTLRAQAISDLGSIPVITWEPWIDDFDPQLFSVTGDAASRNMGGLKAIADGKFDAYIDKWAADAKTYSNPFFLRFGHEMNDPYRYPWGPQNNKPQDYIAAWQHVRDRFHKLHAENAIWVWSPHPAYSYNEFYPGDDYVDWIGTTTINYGTVAPWSQWWSFDDIFGKFYNDISSHKKPIVLTEFGSLSVGGDRALWFKSAFDMMPTKYPDVKGVIFFHVSNDNTTTYKSLDWSFINDQAVISTLKQSIDVAEKKYGMEVGK